MHDSPLINMASLLSIIRSVVGEIHPHWKNLHFLPDTHLERELGLDSMARVELCGQIEKSLGINLDETTAINASTPNELIQAIISQTGNAQPGPGESLDQATGNVMASDLLMGNFGSRDSTDSGRLEDKRTFGEWVYALYAWPVFLLIALLTWVIVVLAPCERWRQKLAHICARMLFVCTFTPFKVTGHEQLDPNAAYILVANHASYLDGFIITAALRIPVHFIVKSELTRVWPARMLLQRFGVEFVDRFNRNRGPGDIRRITEKSRNGQSMVFFPEGTFTSFEGLQPFRMGAFVTAARTNNPVIPIAIKGARKIQRGNHWFPRHGSISVTIRPPVQPEGEGWQVALKLRDAARREISQFCGEDDLLEQ